MNTARIVVPGIALTAGGLAGYLAGNSDPKPVRAEQTAQMATVDVLVARGDIPLGAQINRDAGQWHSWPTTAASSTFIDSEIILSNIRVLAIDQASVPTTATTQK